MEFEFKAPLPATADVVWTHVSDIMSVALCVPGVEEIEPQGEDEYVGLLKVRVGPVRLQLRGIVTIQDLVETERRFVMVAEAADRKIPGQIRTTTALAVSVLDGGESQLEVNTNANILGKLGEFGQPLIRKKTQKVMEEFVENLVKRLEQA